MKNLLLTLSLSILAVCGFAQEATHIKWWNPAQNPFPVMEGQAWIQKVEKPYDRLPLSAKEEVRQPVWNLSKDATGLMIRFRSNASEIVVRYGLEKQIALPHMPATGVSGVDLYAIDSDGNWHWCRGRWNFSDTTTYRFEGLEPNDRYHQQGRKYRLYLPLYNSVDWLEIGVDDQKLFKPLPVRLEKPIVVYGTSIAQGACASRPGMAWTNILGRKMDRPLINLAFSGNGQLEAPLIELLTEIDAKVFVLDCLPNLTSATTFDDQKLRERILKAVRRLKALRPAVPILLTEHAGYTDGTIMPNRLTAYARVNQVQKAAFAELKKEGFLGLHYLSKEEIGLQLDDMVDGTHPNDLGMMRYAESYEQKLRAILHEPIGSMSTTRPCVQSREPDNYDWEGRHREILAMNQTTPPKTVILANSIVHFWGGLPKAPIAREQESWETIFTPKGVRNYAYGWDRIENVLWRIYHGELDGFAADKVVVMIGTNNLHLNSNEEIIEGLRLLGAAIKLRQPQAELVLMGLLPRRDYEARIAALNLQIANLAGTLNVSFGDVGTVFLNPEGTIDESFFSDGLHPNAKGYLQLRESLKPYLVD